MKKENFEAFKTELLSNEIRNCYAEDYYSELLEKSEFIYKYTKREPDNADCSYLLFRKICLRIHHFKCLIALCAELKQKGVAYTGCVELVDDYYENHYKSQIERGKKCLRLLRPFVLEYVKDWSVERRLSDLNNDALSPHLSGWFVTVEACPQADR